MFQWGLVIYVGQRASHEGMGWMAKPCPGKRQGRREDCGLNGGAMPGETPEAQRGLRPGRRSPCPEEWARSRVAGRYLTDTGIRKKGTQTMWYVLQVMSGREADLQALFSFYFDRKLLQDCFSPTYEASYKRDGIRRVVQRRLFPGYLFLVTEDIQAVEWQLKGIPDMTKVLKVDREYIPLTQAEQAFLEQHLNQDHILPMSRGYQAGDEICITEGAFAGYRGRLKTVDRHNRYGVISLTMFGRNVDMQFGLEVVGKGNIADGPAICGGI